MRKVCTKCDKNRLKKFFRLHKDKSGKYYPNSACLKCEKELRAIDYRLNSEKHLKKSREWHKKNKLKMNEYTRKWRKDNPVKYKKRRAKYFKKNKNKIYEQQKITNKKYCEKIRDELTDTFVVKMIKQRSNLKREDIEKVPELIEVAKQKIVLHRLIKTKK